MDIRNLVGMPLRYAISVLQENNMPCRIERTVSRSRFFACAEGVSYVIRARKADDGVVCLLVNDTMKSSASVQQAMQGGEQDYD